MRGGGSNVYRIEYQPNTTGHGYGTYHNWLFLAITFSCLPSRIKASNNHEQGTVGCRDKPLSRAVPQYDHWLHQIALSPPVCWYVVMLLLPMTPWPLRKQPSIT
jgi:hypothetical protein